MGKRKKYTALTRRQVLKLALVALLDVSSRSEGVDSWREAAEEIRAELGKRNTFEKRSSHKLF